LYFEAEGEERRKRQGKPTPWLYVSDTRTSADVYLAFTPWRDEGRRYAAALGKRPFGRAIRPIETPSTARALRPVPLFVDPIEWFVDMPEDGAIEADSSDVADAAR
jgi:hypothetical protein